MLAACQLTLADHGGGVEDDVTDDQVGSPERLGVDSVRLMPLRFDVTRT